MIGHTAYAAIRRNSEREWIDQSTIDCLPSNVREKANKTDALIPQWAKANPVVRIAEIKIDEVLP